MEQLTDSNFEQATATGLVLVDFFAPWCSPCRNIAQTIEAMAKEYEGKVTVCKVDIDENSEVPARFGIKNIPTFILMKDGSEVNRFVGAGFPTTNKIKEALSPLLRE